MLAYLSKNKALSNRTLDSDDRSPFRLRDTLRSFVSTDQQQDTTQPWQYFTLRGAIIVRSGVSIGKEFWIKIYPIRTKDIE